MTGAQLNQIASTSLELPPDDEFPCFQSPEDIVVLVAGGRGVYSVALPTWCGGAHVNRVVSKEIVLGTAYDVPRSFTMG